jgi:hypothetical protein
MTRSTPARLYQLRSKMTTSPAAGRLYVHLALFAFGGRRQRNHAKYARAHALGNRLDGAALASSIATLEQDADLESLVHYPALGLDQLDMQLAHLLLEGLPVQPF